MSNIMGGTDPAADTLPSLADREAEPGTSCPGCAADSAGWTDPVSRDGETYCCADCAEGRACHCGGPAAGQA